MTGVLMGSPCETAMLGSVRPVARAEGHLHHTRTRGHGA